MSDVEPIEDAAVAPSGDPLKHSAIRVARVVVLVAVLAGTAYALVVEWRDVRHTIYALSWKSLLAASLTVVAGMFAGVKVWQHLLAAMGTRVRYPHAAQVNMIGQLGKYLPGGVWALALQAQLAKHYGISRARAFVALLLTAGMTSVTALTLAALAAPSLSHQWGRFAWVLLIGPLSLVALVPAALTRITNLALRAMRRPSLDIPLRPEQIVRAALWSIVSWLLFGLHLWLLTGSVARQPIAAYAIATGAFGLAMSAGFIAFLLPSGVGVREVVIVAGLAPLATSSAALAIALASRLVFTLADITCALLAGLWARKQLRQPLAEARPATHAAAMNSGR